ncbi:MAG: hypothetical protein AABY15_07265 [Nanoarchaeota archaeon]
MTQEERKELIEYLQEIDPDIEFDKDNEDKLIGYAERFGGAIIPMYQGVNTFFIKEIGDLIAEVTQFNSRARIADGFEDTLIGYMNIDGYYVFLHDREKMIEKMISEYKSDPLFDGDDLYLMAMENYEFNIIGAYMEGVPAFAVIGE